ncbi:MAG: hypothetical protein DRG78_05825 [Epsilonproteobacteria bacterium]|nr:MAG: hypothetical protein DRG78_05825 [Campylobacterota bacterium]
MKVSEYIGKFFEEKGIYDIFLVDGGACASIIVGVTKNKKLNYFCPQHEQGGSFAIDGYYKASRKVSAMIATSGPAGQNLINGIAASWYDSVPAIYITGNVKTTMLKESDYSRQLGFQESNIVTMVESVTKYTTLITKASYIRYELEKAYHYATSGRPGPVLIDIPMDIQETLINETALLGFNQHYKNTFLSSSVENSMLEIIDLLKNAKKPAILLGGGVWLSDANSLVKQLINQLQIPYFVTWHMVDFDSYDNELYGGKVGTFAGEGRNIAIQQCDVLLCLGSRLPVRVTGNNIQTFAQNAKKIMVNIDQEEFMTHPILIDKFIQLDIKDFTSKFIDMTKKLEFCNQEWNNNIKLWKETYGVVKSEYYNMANVHPYVFMEKLSEKLTKDAVIVSEAGGNAVVTYQTYKAKNGQRIFSNHGNSSLGYALPAAIGAAIALKQEIICLTGDGGLAFNIQELQTIKQYSLPIKIIIFNNNCYGITKAFRDSNFDKNYQGCDAEHGLSSPDYIEVAKAYEIKTLKINHIDELNDALDYILDYKEAILVDVNMKNYNDYQPRVEGMNSIDNMFPVI